MLIAFGILAVVALYWGGMTGRIARTMSNGPRQGTIYGGFLFAGIGGSLYGVIAGFFLAPGVIGCAIIGVLTALVSFVLAAFAGYNLKR